MVAVVTFVVIGFLNKSEFQENKIVHISQYPTELLRVISFDGARNCLTEFGLKLRKFYRHGPFCEYAQAFWEHAMETLVACCMMVADCIFCTFGRWSLAWRGSLVAVRWVWSLVAHLTLITRSRWNGSLYIMNFLVVLRLTHSSNYFFPCRMSTKACPYNQHLQEVKVANQCYNRLPDHRH